MAHLVDNALFSLMPGPQLPILLPLIATSVLTFQYSHLPLFPLATQLDHIFILSPSLTCLTLTNIILLEEGKHQHSLPAFTLSQ